MKEAGFEFVSVPACIDETQMQGETGVEHVTRLSLEKARKVKPILNKLLRQSKKLLFVVRRRITSRMAPEHGILKRYSPAWHSAV